MLEVHDRDMPRIPPRDDPCESISPGFSPRKLEHGLGEVGGSVSGIPPGFEAQARTMSHRCSTDVTGMGPAHPRYQQARH